MCETVDGPQRPPAGPCWARLYAVTLPQLTALGVIETTSLAHLAPTMVRTVLALATFAGMAWWVHTSRTALDLQDWCACAPRTITVRVIESHPIVELVPVHAPASIAARAAAAETKVCTARPAIGAGSHHALAAADPPVGARGDADIARRA